MSQTLPIYEVMPAVRKHLTATNTLIVHAPPGAGKSTALPLELLDAPWLAGQKILLLEPRRLAARAVAHRMAELLGEKVGQRVGYRVRFDTKVSAATRIEVLTEGILTRMLQQDNALEGVGLVIFDEFHERSLHADLGLVLCRQIQEILREDLRLLLMSATLDTGHLSDLLGQCPVVTSAGRQYPVSHRYLAAAPGTRLHAHVVRVIHTALREVPGGDVLVFLPGTGDIRRCHALLEDLDVAIVYPLYGDLPQAEQEKALLPDPQGRRKVVLATSIAETSLTIQGIEVVVDSGQARVPRFDPRSGLTRLETVDVTRDAADQRSGRAGRLGPGTCYRLWDEGAHRHLLPQRKPEIEAADLAPLALELAAWGVTDLAELAWPTPPPPGPLAQAQALLSQLGALEGGRITPRGEAMLRLPTHPRIAHMLLEGQAEGMGALAADIAALLDARDPLARDAGADLRLRLDALRHARAQERHAGDRKAIAAILRVAAVWQRILKVAPRTELGDPLAAGSLLAAAFPERIAKGIDPVQGRFRLSNRRTASVEQHDPLADVPWLAVAHLDAGQGEGRIFLAAPVDPEALVARMSEHEVLDWDRRAGILLARRETRIGNLLLRSTPTDDLSEKAVVDVLCKALKADASLLTWPPKVEAWLARVLSLRAWRPDEDWPDLRPATLLADPAFWLAPYLGKVRKQEDFARLDLQNILLGRLPWELSSRVASLAPTHLEVPSGSRVALQYFPDGRPPVLAVRLQEMFGQLDTPSVNEGRTQVMVHLLSPARRPVQVTQDLRHFWKHTYLDVRKDMRGRYSKHYWPEDPFTAQAIRGVRPKK